MNSPIAKSLVFSAILALSSAVPAAAQGQDESTAPPAPAFQINASFLPEAPAPATSSDDLSFDEQATPKTHALGDRQVFVRLEGGLVFCCSNTGFVVGVGVSAMPKSVKNLEIAGSFGIGRLAGFTFFDFSGDGLYDFHLKGHEAMPFAGAGLGIQHLDSTTKAAFELAGGVQMPIQGPHVVRFEVKFLFTTQTTTVLLVSYSF